MADDMAIWARQDGTAFAINPQFPINTIAMMRGCVAAQRRGKLEAFAGALFDGMWRDARDMGDMAVLAGVISTAGLDVAAYAAAMDDQSAKVELRTNTEAAVAAGVFGVPSFPVGERLFFGQDRSHFVELALKAEI